MSWKRVLQHGFSNKTCSTVPPLLFSQIVMDAASAASARDNHAAVRHPVGPAPTMRMDLEAAAATAPDMMKVCHQRIVAKMWQANAPPVLFKKWIPKKKKLSTAGIEPALFRTST